ncbi:unnamed protein product [Cuscuta campestris]|uniref:Uncharacterized protein n=1 Tax=Cuscuta campestris TaxID=132261 RepID=A0A484LJP4_9ASTE|nr:unnamed protein product [Cuscuta campestris]
MQMLRWTCGKTRLDRIPNDIIREQVGVASVESKLREARLRRLRKGYARRNARLVSLSSVTLCPPLCRRLETPTRKPTPPVAAIFLVLRRYFRPRIAEGEEQPSVLSLVSADQGSAVTRRRLQEFRRHSPLLPPSGAAGRQYQEGVVAASPSQSKVEFVKFRGRNTDLDGQPGQ